MSHYSGYSNDRLEKRRINCEKEIARIERSQKGRAYWKRLELQAARHRLLQINAEILTRSLQQKILW